jgi:hypothetical protein
LNVVFSLPKHIPVKYSAYQPTLNQLINQQMASSYPCPPICFCSVHYDNTLKAEDDYYDDLQKQLEEPYPFERTEVPQLPVPIDSPAVAAPVPAPVPDIAPPVPDVPPHAAATITAPRVNLDEHPWQDGEAHCPGLIARYVLDIQSGGNAILRTKTWSNIYREHRFRLSNLISTNLEQHNTTYKVMFNMRRGGYFFLQFETLEDAQECHYYLYRCVGR